jgi:SET domain-containing protein
MPKFVISKSKIHGLGVIASQRIKKNEIIGPGIEYIFFVIPNITSHLGKWVNHSYSPTARLVFLEPAYQVVANRDLNIGEEITVNYNTCPWFIKKAQPHYT